jgi:hypothetical protein
MKKETKTIVEHLTEIEKEIIEIFDLTDENTTVLNFDLEEFLYVIQENKEELIRLKNFKIGKF